MDITKLDFDDNSVTEILASHVFEHLNPYHSTDILREWLRVLKPGGKIIMEMPDIEKLCEKFLKSDTGGRYGVLNAIYGSVNTTNEGGPDNITSPHLFGWWPQSLYDHMSNAGFVNIVFMDEQIPHPEANFRVEAIKPGLTELTRADLEQQDTQLCFEILDRKEYGILPEEFVGKDVLDIGANIGVFSFYATNGGANRVVAVEANPVIYGTLNSNAKRMKNVTAINAAAWSTNDDTISIQHHGVMSRVAEIGMPVKTITLEKLSEGFSDAILKLDVEGSEFEVLKYVQPETLRKFQTILVELHGEYGDISTIRAMFDNCGFRKVHQFQYYNDDGLIEVYVERWARI
jgi:FkbM family methyltransferase